MKPVSLSTEGERDWGMMRTQSVRLPFVGFWFQQRPSSSARAPGGKVGNRVLVFHFSRRRTPGRWECENPAFGFSRGGGKRGKPGFGFPRFPRARHFHGPLALAERRRQRRLHFALPQQPRLGGVHLPRAFGVAHRQRLAVQLRQTQPRLEILLGPLQRFQFLERRPIVRGLVLTATFATLVQAHRGKAAGR